MAWENLPTNYQDAVWSGLRKYTQINNGDSTVSFQDVTVYSQKDNSFFGAKDANRMNTALNTIMAALNKGTDLYEDFLAYFNGQKTQFEKKATQTQDGFTAYVNNLKSKGDTNIANLKTEGDKLISQIKNGYASDIDVFKNAQEAAFNAWFKAMQDALSQDVAGNLQNQYTELEERLTLLESMTIRNHFTAPLATNDSSVTLIVDENNNAILAEWHHKEG